MSEQNNNQRVTKLRRRTEDRIIHEGLTLMNQSPGLVAAWLRITYAAALANQQRMERRSYPKSAAVAMSLRDPRDLTRIERKMADEAEG